MAVEIRYSRPIDDWVALINDANSVFHNRLDKIYDGHDDLKAEAVRMSLRTLEAFAERYGSNRSVIIVRSTGRVNLLGTHIDQCSNNQVCRRIVYNGYAIGILQAKRLIKAVTRRPRPEKSCSARAAAVSTPDTSVLPVLRAHFLRLRLCAHPVP